MKKVIAVAFSMIFVLLAFAGCGSDNSNSDVELSKVLSDVNDNGGLSSMKTITNTTDLQKQFDIDPESVSDFIAEVSEDSEFPTTVIVTKAVEQVNKKYYEEDFDKQMQAKSIISKEIEDRGCIVVNEVADKIFMGEPELIEEFTEKVDRYNIANDTIIPQSKTTTRKLERQHLTTDSGIEIKIPMELYNNEDDIEFITNEDGTMSMIIKNINSIVNISINIVYTSKKSVGGLIFNILNGKSL